MILQYRKIRIFLSLHRHTLHLDQPSRTTDWSPDHDVWLVWEAFSIQRLYALGECSCTGLHGGNRLASNSLIEAVVYADAAAKDSLAHVDLYDYNDRVPEWNDEGTMTNEEKVLITQSVKEVNQIMSNYVGIVRSDLRLHRAWDRLDMLYEETERLFKRVKASRDICELRNMINVGYLITRWALERKECRGLHFTTDYPLHAYDKK